MTRTFTARSYGVPRTLGTCVPPRGAAGGRLTGQSAESRDPRRDRDSGREERCAQQPYSSIPPTTTTATSRWPRASSAPPPRTAPSSSSLPEKWTVLGPPEALQTHAEPLDGPALTAAAGWARSSASTCWPAASPSASRAARSSATPPCCSAPTASSSAVYRKIHMFDVDVEGRRLPRVGDRGARRRDRHRRCRPATRLGHDHLLRPPLPRALPDPRAQRRAGDLGALGVHRAHRARPLGGPAARSRDREPGLRHRRRTRSATRRRTSRATAAR